jgi:N-carbamoyl-D-amino-acid hydrolase
MDRSFNLAVAQIGGVQPSEDRAAVVRRLVRLLEDAHGKGAEFIVYPELTLTTFFPRYWFDDPADIDRYFESAMPGGEVQALFERATALGVGFYLGYAELTPDGHHYNTAILVDSAGVIQGKYRKVHLPGHAGKIEGLSAQHLEKRYFEVGDLGFGVFEVDGIRFGMCLCNDRRWPEVYRVLALQGADVAVLGYNTPMEVPGWQEEPHSKMSTHLLCLRAGAYQNAMWVAAAGKSGDEDGSHLIGGSAIAAPSGEIVAKARTEADEVVMTPVDLDYSEPYRQSVFNFSAHRRPENYSLIVDRAGRGDPLPVKFL